MPTPRDLDSLRGFMGNIAIFGGLADASIERVVRMLDEQVVAPGTTICREGEPGSSMYVVRTGEVVVSRLASSGNVVRMVRLGPGEVFGEMTLIDVQARSATVTVADGPATLCVLTNRDLYKLYREDVDAYVMVIQNICRELSRRLRKADAALTERADSAGDDATLIKPLPEWMRPPTE
jgi:CRP/FNR family cyclic AMP-dependent transcriptional regulator